MARLEEICSLITDGSHFSPEDEGVGYPMFSVKDMTPNGFNISGCKKIGEEAYKKLVANGCKPLNDDVVVAKDGSYLKTAFVIKGNPEITLLSSIAILRPKIDLVVPEYLSYFLKSDAVYRTVSLNYITGTALKRIILKGIRKIEVDLPDIGEQEQRAQRLSKVDYLCQLRKQQLAKLDELVKARFVEMFGDPYMNNKHYPLRKGESFFKLSNGKTVSEDKRLSNGVPAYGGNGISWYTNESLFNHDTIVVGRVGFQSGNVHIAKGPLWITDNAMYMSSCDFSQYNLIFLINLMEHIDFTKFQDAGDLKKITQKPFMQYEYICPPLPLQNQFAAFVERVDRQKQTVQQSLEKLELMKKALMQEYFG